MSFCPDLSFALLLALGLHALELEVGLYVERALTSATSFCWLAVQHECALLVPSSFDFNSRDADTGSKHKYLVMHGSM